MNLKFMCFLSAVLLPALVAFKVDFGEGEYATYELENMDPKKIVENMQGLEGFVRFATVLTATGKCIFKEQTRVALKIAFPEKEISLKREQEAHNFIRKRAFEGQIDGVVQAEMFLGESEDLHNDKLFLLPKNGSKQDKYVVLVMKAYGENLLTLYNRHVEFSDEHLLQFHKQLGVIFRKLWSIDFAHGDVKPANILVKEGSNLKSGIVLADLGLAVYDGPLANKNCSGNLLYVSPVQLLLDRPATCGDSEVGGAYTLAFLATSDLPWLTIFNDSLLPKSDQQFDLHIERIVVMKHEFNLDPFASCSVPISTDLKNAITATIRNAMKEESPDNIEIIKNNIVKISNKSKNG